MSLASYQALSWNDLGPKSGCSRGREKNTRWSSLSYPRICSPSLLARQRFLFPGNPAPITLSSCQRFESSGSNGDRLRGLCIGSSRRRCHWGSGSEGRTKRGNLTVKSSLSDSVGVIMDGIASNWNADPPTWNSSLISVGIIFAVAAPLLWVGLTPQGILSAYVLGSVIWRAYGGQGLVTIVLFYIIGTAATKLKLKEKQKEGIAEKRSGRRGPGSVWGSGSAGLLCALFTILGVGSPDITPLWKLGYLASLCTKLSDTVSSEIGKAYGKTTYLVTTFSVVPRGTEGAVSLEGTIAGLVAALFLVVSSFFLNQVDSTGGVIALVASQVANLFESYLGATLQGRPGFEWLSNDLVNVANITVGASLAILGQKFLTGS
ncbi:hypothetical protein R1sor_023622 [Riccia sorocarpa]|uniref:Protein VTE6, chloroplastic n=1 Tax=Riccia sorocarpa TaxID=122646 RepID=A0ABD3GS73_9MARC